MKTPPLFISEAFVGTDVKAPSGRLRTGVIIYVIGHSNIGDPIAGGGCGYFVRTMVRF